MSIKTTAADHMERAAFACGGEPVTAALAGDDGGMHDRGIQIIGVYVEARYRLPPHRLTAMCQPAREYRRS